MRLNTGKGKCMQIKSIDNLVFAQFESICNAANKAMYSSQSRIKLEGTERFRLLFARGQVAFIEKKSAAEKIKHLCSVLNHTSNGETGNTVAITGEEFEDLGMKLIEVATRIDSSTLYAGRLSDSQWPRLTESVERLRRSRAYLVGGKGLTIFEVSAICMGIADKHGSIDRVVIDSACLKVESQTGMRRTLREQSKPEIFDELAAQLGCAVVLFSVVQTNPE